MTIKNEERRKMKKLEDINECIDEKRAIKYAERRKWQRKMRRILLFGIGFIFFFLLIVLFIQNSAVKSKGGDVSKKYLFRAN